MEIRKYRPSDEDSLMTMIRIEGEEWICYWADDVSPKYRLALSDSITYVAVQDGVVRGYVRALDDCGFYIYVCDLLVTPAFRGQSLGRKLMEALYLEYPQHTVFVMSDVDGYYQKQGYHREGSVFEVTAPSA